jgi:hypothetical protein
MKKTSLGKGVIKITYAMPGNFDSQVFASTFFANAYNFGPEHTHRLAKYQNCWDFYDGKHWSMATPEGYKQVTVNYTKVFVKKLRRFAFRNGWTMDFSPEQEADKIDKWVNDVWDANDRFDLTSKIVEFGSIFGDWYIYPQWLPDVEMDSKLPKSSQVKLTVLDPRYVFPQYNNKTGEMEFCVILIPYENIELQPDGNFEYVARLYREVHTKDKIFIQDLDDQNTVVEERVVENPLKKILVIHGVHQIQAGSNYGAGLVEDLIGPQKLFNEKVSNISEILDYHAAPITIIYGAKARQLEKGANKLWSGLPANAKVENLSSEGNIPTAREFVQDTKTWMHELANIPEDALGANRKISNTSAVALSIDFEPLIELSDDVRFYFNQGIKAVNELVIDIGLYLDEIKTNLEPPAKYAMGIEHGALLPRDRSLDLADMNMEITMGIESKAGALKRLGNTNPQEKLDEIDKEVEAEKKRAMELATKYMDPAMVAQIGNPNNLPGKPPVAPATTVQKGKAGKAVNNSDVVHGQQVADTAKAKKA